MPTSKNTSVFKNTVWKLGRRSETTESQGKFHGNIKLLKYALSGTYFLSSRFAYSVLVLYTEKARNDY